MRIPCFGILHAIERHDRPYGDDVLRIGETPYIEADVPDEIWRLEHSGGMRYRHALVRRDSAQELVGGGRGPLLCEQGEPTSRGRSCQHDTE
jgi:hypothetical protein